MKAEKVQFRLVGYFLAEFKREEMMNQQKFVKEVKRVVRESRYKDQALIEESKRRMNKYI